MSTDRMVSRFNIFNSINFYSKIINSLSSMSFLVYIIHANRLVQDIFIMNLFVKIFDTFGDEYPLLWTSIVGCSFIVASLVFGSIYRKYIQFAAYKCSDYLTHIFQKQFEIKINRLIETHECNSNKML